MLRSRYLKKYKHKKMNKFVKNTQEEILSKFKNTYNIDLLKYKNQDVTEKISQMITFPLYAFKTIFYTVFLFLILYFCLPFLIEITGWEWLTYLVVCSFAFFFIGFFAGINIFLYRLKTDLSKILEYALSSHESIFNDIKNANSKFVEENESIVADIIKGYILVVILPSIIEIVGNKVPLIGKLISNKISQILTDLLNKLDFSKLNFNSSKINKPLDSGTDKLNSLTNEYLKIINSKIGSSIFLIQKPFIVFLIIVTLPTLLILYYLGRENI